MRRRIPDLILVVALVVGGVLAWRTARERTRLSADHDRLVRAAGDLPISDPAKAHFRAIETGEPLHYAWRVHVPAGSSMRIRSRSGMTSAIAGPRPEEFIARVRFREDEQGSWSVYQSFHGGSTRGSLGGKELNEFLSKYAGRLRVEQLGASGTAAVKPDGPAVLLRLSMPEAMQAEARKTLSAFDQGRFLPDLFLLEIGPEKPPPTSPPPGP